MKEFLSEIEVFFVKKRALNVIYQYIRQERKAKKTDQKEVRKIFLALKWKFVPKIRSL